MYSLVLRPLPLLPSVCNHNNIQKRKSSEKQGRPGRQTDRQADRQTDNDDRWTVMTVTTDRHDRSLYSLCMCVEQ